MYNTLFALAALGTPLWLLMIFAPAWRPVRRLAESAVVPLFLSALYLLGIGAFLIQSGPSFMADFGNAAGVTRLLANPAIALVAWIHILAFDQLVGLYIYRDNMANRYLPLPVQSVLLLLTFMLGPVGFLSYYLLRALRQVQARKIVAGSPSIWRGERAHVVLGVIGVAVMALCIGALYLNGSPFIGPEGNLIKPIRFAFSVAIMSFTLVFVLPLAGFSEAGLRRWRWFNVVITLYAYFGETFMTFQGLDPRFSRHIANWTQGGISIGIAATGVAWAVMYPILLWVIFRRGSVRRPVISLGLRYGMGSVMLATAGGIWMAAMQSHLTATGGDTMWLHALGFHGLQAIPLVAWLLERSNLDERSARRWVHGCGLAWLAATTFAGVHAAMGFTLADYSPALVGFAVALLAWSFTAVNAVKPTERQAA